jgi:hypothetical protein
VSPITLALITGFIFVVIGLFYSFTAREDEDVEEVA